MLSIVFALLRLRRLVDHHRHAWQPPCSSRSWSLRLAKWQPTMDLKSPRRRPALRVRPLPVGKLAARCLEQGRRQDGRGASMFNGATLGVYGNAYNLCTTASKPIYSLILRVTFPALSKIQHDIPAMRRAVIAAVSNVALVTVPHSPSVSRSPPTISSPSSTKSDGYRWCRSYASWPFTGSWRAWHRSRRLC